MGGGVVIAYEAVKNRLIYICKKQSCKKKIKAKFSNLEAFDSEDMV